MGQFEKKGWQVLTLNNQNSPDLFVIRSLDHKITEDCKYFAQWESFKKTLNNWVSPSPVVVRNKRTKSLKIAEVWATQCNFMGDLKWKGLEKGFKVPIQHCLLPCKNINIFLSEIYFNVIFDPSIFIKARYCYLVFKKLATKLTSLISSWKAGTVSLECQTFSIK